MIFESHDWRSLIHPVEIQRYAGVPGENMQKLVFKELCDNALDAGYTCEYGVEYIGDGSQDGYIFIQDDGPGLPGDSISDWCDLFSVSRNLKTSKMIRLPTRGALGNGLRVVSGYVHATGGKMIVKTRGYRFRVVIDEQTGISQPADVETCDCNGTRIEVYLKNYTNSLDWVQSAVYLSQYGETYSGKTSAYWYDDDSFYNLCRAAPGDCSIRGLVETFDGCTGKRAADICNEFKESNGYKPANTLTKAETDGILKNIREQVKPVSHNRLGFIGPDAYQDQTDTPIYYEKVTGEYHLMSSYPAKIPVIVEVWVNVSDHPGINVTINRTPTTGTVSMQHWYKDKQLALSGCGLDEKFYVTAINDIKKPVCACINITAPYMPILSSGKSPDLSHIQDLIREAIGKAAKKAIRKIPKEPKKDTITIKDAVWGLVETGRELAGDGLRFTQRNLFYSIRDFVLKLSGKTLQFNYFTDCITDYENEFGDIQDMTRDPRGFIKHPHIEHEIPLGTESVESYIRPDWNYNKILFIEKEGFVQILNQLNWPEKHDCAVMTSKGMPSRAVRDLIDKITIRADEPVTVFCLHDADAAGTRIYQSLQEETKARPGRAIKIVNLGLEPWEALDMCLSVEDVEYKGNNGNVRYQPVADYVKNRDGNNWDQWLQNHRVELNAIVPTRRFLDWIDRKMADYDGKVIPPDSVIEDETNDVLREQLRSQILDEYEEKINKELETRFNSVKPKLDFSKVFKAVNDLKPGIETTWRDIVSVHCEEAIS